MNIIFSNVSLSYCCMQTLLGGLLGDGSLKIQKNYRNARYQIRHSIAQREYLEWKQKQLEEVALLKLQVQKADGFSALQKISLQSKAHPELTKIHSVVCKNNTLCIQRDWLNALDELALLIWWLDDGSLVSKRKQGCFCTDNFCLQEVELLKQWLEERWNIATKVTGIKKVNGNKPVYYRLYFNTTEVKKLFNLIMPHLEVGTMVNKFTLKYNNFDYQQRWICTMKDKMPEKMHKEIDQWYTVSL